MPAPEIPPRCPPEADLEDVMEEQFAYLMAMVHDRHLTPGERARINRLRAVLLEPFNETGTIRAMAA